MKLSRILILLLVLLMVFGTAALAQDAPQMALTSGQDTVYIGHGNYIYSTKSTEPLCEMAVSALLYVDNARLVFVAQGCLMEISLAAERDEPKNIDQIAVGGVYVPQDGMIYYISETDDSKLRGFSPVEGAYRDVADLAHEIGSMSYSLDGLVIEAAGGDLLFVPQTGEFVDSAAYTEGVTEQVFDSFETLLGADGSLRLRSKSQKAGESIAVDDGVLAATALGGVTYYLKNDGDVTGLYDYSYATNAKANVAKFQSKVLPQLAAAGGSVYALGEDGTVYALNVDSHVVSTFAEVTPMPADPILVATDSQVLVYNAVTSRNLVFVQALPIDEESIPLIVPEDPADDQAKEDEAAPEAAKPEEPKEPEVLTRGSRGDDVLALQKILHEHKYPVGKPDGIFGSATADAVKYLQYDLGKKETGSFNVSQIEWLRENCPTYHVYVEMRKGDNGIRVYDLQVRLHNLGYLSAKANGNFGSQTEAAVKLFEKAMSEKESGVATAKVVEQIFSKKAVKAWDAFSDITNPNEKQPQKQHTKQTVSEDDLITMVRWMNNNIPGKSLNKKNAILAVQSRLCDLGYMKKKQRSSVYDSNTVKAMKKFQDDYNPGTKPDGIPTTKTMELLFPSKLF